MSGKASSKLFSFKSFMKNVVFPKNKVPSQI